MPEPTFWDLMESFFPEGESKEVVTFACGECKQEGHFIVFHCQCGFNLTACAFCTYSHDARSQVVRTLYDHAVNCEPGKVLLGAFK